MTQIHLIHDFGAEITKSSTHLPKLLWASNVWGMDLPNPNFLTKTNWSWNLFVFPQTWQEILSLSFSLSQRVKKKQHLISSTPSYFHQKILGFREQIKPVESTCLWGVHIASKNCIRTWKSPPQEKISIFFHCKQNGGIKIPPNSSTIQSLLSSSSTIHSFLPCPAKIFFNSSSSSGLKNPKILPWISSKPTNPIKRTSNSPDLWTLKSSHLNFFKTHQPNKDD